MDGEKFSTKLTEAQVNEEAQAPPPLGDLLKGGSISIPNYFDIPFLCYFGLPRSRSDLRRVRTSEG